MAVPSDHSGPVLSSPVMKNMPATWSSKAAEAGEQTIARGGGPLRRASSEPHAPSGRKIPQNSSRRSR
jgi:hypothetical protein